MRFIQSIIVFTLQLAVFVQLALQRLIARDEGFYLLAAKLVTEGKIPYRDFFFPQMPLSPYIYGVWMSLFGMTWESGRIFSAVIAAVIGTLLFLYCKKRFGLGWGIVAVALYLSCNFVFPWYLNVRTYSLSVLWLFSAFLLLDRAFSAQTGTRVFIAGLLFGLAIDTRLFFIGVLPFVGLALWLREKDRCFGFNQALLLGLGAGIALLPNLPLFLLDPAQYFFNNFGYHTIRSDYSDAQALNNRWRVLRVLLGLVQGQSFTAPQLPILLWLSVTGLVVGVYKYRRIELALCFVAPLFVLNLLPKPTYLQYASTLVPFLIISALFTISEGVKFCQARSSPRRLIRNGLLLTLAFGYFAFAPADLVRYTSSGEGVIGIRDEKNAELWNIESIQQISQRINELSQPGDYVLAFWPGHIFESHAQALPGMENHFGFGIAGKLSPEERKHQRVISAAELQIAIKGQVPALAVIKIRSKSRIRKQLLAAGYRRQKDYAGMEWYKRIDAESPKSGSEGLT